MSVSRRKFLGAGAALPLLLGPPQDAPVQTATSPQGPIFVKLEVELDADFQRLLRPLARVLAEIGETHPGSLCCRHPGTVPLQDLPPSIVLETEYSGWDRRWNGAGPHRAIGGAFVCMFAQRLNRLMPGILFPGHKPQAELLDRPVIDINIFRPTAYCGTYVPDDGWCRFPSGVQYRSDWGRLSDALVSVNSLIEAGNLNYRTAIISVGKGAAQALKCLERFPLPPGSMVWACDLDAGAELARRVQHMIIG